MKTCLLATLLIAAMLIAAACGGSDDAATSQDAPTTPSPSPTPPPIDIPGILNRTGENMAALTSFRVRLTHDPGSTRLLPGLKVFQADAEIVSPDRLSATFKGAFGTLAVNASLVTIGETSYMTNPLTGKWQEVLTEVSPLGFFSPQNGIAAIMARVYDVEGPAGEAGAVLTLHGSLPAEALESLLGPSKEDAVVRVELVIDTDQHLLTGVRIEGKAVPLDDETTVRVLTLSAFNEPLVIEPPE